MDITYWTLVFINGNNSLEIRISGIEADSIEEAEKIAREKWNIRYHLSDFFEGV